MLDDETASKAVGLGLFPAACLLNHGCVPPHVEKKPDVAGQHRRSWLAEAWGSLCSLSGKPAFSAYHTMCKASAQWPRPMHPPARPARPAPDQARGASSRGPCSGPVLAGRSHRACFPHRYHPRCSTTGRVGARCTCAPRARVIARVRARVGAGVRRSLHVRALAPLAVLHPLPCHYTTLPCHTPYHATPPYHATLS